MSPRCQEPVLNTAVNADRAPIVIMASGAGTLLQAVVAAAQSPDYPAVVAGVVVDRQCRAQSVAEAAGIPVVQCRLSDYPDRTSWDRALTEAVATFRPAMVLTAGFMKILGAQFLSRFSGSIINAHPALLPSFPGAHAVADALAHGVKVTGTTIHVVDGGVDTGPILAQAPVIIHDGDDEASLHERIKIVEHVLVTSSVAQFVTRDVVYDGRKARFT